MRSADEKEQRVIGEGDMGYGNQVLNLLSAWRTGILIRYCSQEESRLKRMAKLSQCGSDIYFLLTLVT